MKLQTSIKPRLEGTVEVLGQDRQTYTFVPGSDGSLECDITDVPTLKALLRSQNFYPADPADHAAALELAMPDPEPEPDVADGRDPADKTDDELDLDDDEGDPNAMPVEGAAAALPIEAETPPQVAPDRAAKANAAAAKKASKK